MSALHILEDFLAGRIRLLSAPDEGAWHRIWHSEGLAARAPALSALHGGLLADRLPWVFISGYQAAIRKFFPGLPSFGWAAVAATEDQKQPEKFPGTEITSVAGVDVLNGHKSWVAQSRHLQHLLVTVGPQTLLLDAGQSGVSLSHREAPEFLAAMSQGFAKFINAPLVSPARFPKARLRGFARGEAKFVMLASTGFLLAQLGDRDADLRSQLITLAFSLVTICERANISPVLLAELDRALQNCVAKFEAAAMATGIPAWQADKRLLSMYSARIQNRALRS